jgi:predicted negative regulator of RcsB-dependent stress response
MWRRHKLRRWWRDYGFTVVVVLVLLAVAWLIAER